MSKPVTAVHKAEPPDGVVYVIQQPRPKDGGWTPNFEPATKYGRIEFVFDMSDRAYADPQSALRKAMSRLAKFNPEKDYLLWANFGDPATCWLVIMSLVARGFFRLRYLYWSRGKLDGQMSNENGFYFPIEIDVNIATRAQ